jgi:hypothetical protein
MALVLELYGGVLAFSTIVFLAIAWASNRGRSRNQIDQRASVKRSKSTLAMTVDMRLEFENEAASLASKVCGRDDRFRAALFILPDGSTLEFDRYLAELKARQDRQCNRHDTPL